MNSFLKYLEKNCPGDDAHSGYGDPRPLLDRCGFCCELYEEHRKGILEERENCARIAESEPALDGPMPPENVEAVMRVGLEKAFQVTVSMTTKAIAGRIRGQEISQPSCTCLPAGPSLDHSDTCAFEQWRKAK